MNTRNNQTGRSMVETLGVLAIIGVLSIGGIAGYTWGMNKLRTNEILDGANKRAATVAMQQGVRTVSLREFDAERVMAGGTFASEVVTEGLNGQFGIKVTGVTEAVCENLAQLMESEENAAIRNVTDGSLTKLTEDSCGETNEVVLVYNNDMGVIDSVVGSNTENQCETGIVKIRRCDGSLTDCCPDNGNTCTQPTCTCTSNSNCFGQQICDGGTCQCPAQWGGRGTLGSDGLTCCNEYHLEWNNLYSDYMSMNVAACGCPYNGTLASDGTTCCSDGFAYTSGTYGPNESVNAAACGCPSGYVLASDGTTCCSEYGGNTYNGDTNFALCGCPNNGTLASDGKTCCSNGFAYKEEDDWYIRYTDISACGCPSGGTLASDGATCCKNNFSWNEGQSTYVSYNEICVDGEAPLYVTTDCSATHKEWVSGAASCSCPTGYHWASSSEFRSDFDCPPYTGNNATHCKSSGMSALLSECTTGYGVIAACSDYNNAFYSMDYALSRSSRTYPRPALCRRD